MSLPQDCVELIAALVASPDREIDDVARDAKNLVRAGHVDMSSAVWACVARLADGLGSFEDEARQSGCNPSKNADKWDIVRLAHACGFQNAYSKAMYRLVEELNESTEPVHDQYCDVPRCVALYVLRMSFRWMPYERVRFAYGDRVLRGVPQSQHGFLFSTLRRAPIKGPTDWRADLRRCIDKFLAEHGVDRRPFWVKTYSDADRLVRQTKLRRLGLPTFMATWFGHNDIKYMLDNVGRYAAVAAALGETVEKVFGRRYGDWDKASKVLIDKALDRLEGRIRRVLLTYEYAFTEDDVRMACEQTERARAILDSAPHAGSYLILGKDDEAKVVIGDVNHYLGGQACPP
jgi:hypothetical protein